jgi:hypothetical protein
VNTLTRTFCLSLAALFALAAPRPASAADPMFNGAVLHETRIVMDPSDWQALRNNFRTNQYYAANVSVDGEVIEQVGVRSRGKGSRDPQKPGLRLDFNRYGRTRDFRGMKSLVLDNEIQDTSVLREFLAYRVFHEMNIPTPGISFTRVTVNDEYWGVYALTEDVRKSFLKAQFEDDDGNLFQYEWDGAWDFSWRGEEASRYVPRPFEPQTNEDSLDPSGLVGFIRTINQASDAQFLSEISHYLDVDAFVTYLAVENAIAESDGLLGDQGMNNFYLYEFSRTPQFVFIPWDKDTSFQNPSWPLLRGIEGNVLARRLLADARLQRVYVEAVQRAVSRFVNSRWLLPQLESAYALIREAVLSDTKKPYSNHEFEVAVEGLRGIIASREDDVRGQIGAVSASLGARAVRATPRSSTTAGKNSRRQAR